MLFRRFGLHLLRLRFFLGKIGSLETLSAKSNFRDAHRGKVLPVAAQLLVLLLALVMKNQDLLAAAFADNFADHARVWLLAHLALFAGDRQHGELQMPVSAGPDLLHSNYIAGRHPVLLPTGADNRVHTSSQGMSLKFS